jgi:hypothetical protein
MQTNSAYDNELVVEEYYNTMQNLQKNLPICKTQKIYLKTSNYK